MKKATRVTTARKKLENSKLQHGAYTEVVPGNVQQLKYMAGGYPGSGGFCEALKIKAKSKTVYILHEYRSDCDGNLHRWQEFKIEQLNFIWHLAWSMCSEKSGGNWSKWQKITWWNSETDTNKAEATEE